jgi:hypothetical protein
VNHPVKLIQHRLLAIRILANYVPYVLTEPERLGYTIDDPSEDESDQQGKEELEEYDGQLQGSEGFNSSKEGYYNCQKIHFVPLHLRRIEFQESDPGILF